MSGFVDFANKLIWGAPALILILGVGVYLSVKTGFAQFRLFPEAWKQFLRKLSGKERTDGVSSFQALCTALAATVGTGNLVGVAGAIALGGPGSIFWMWVCALLGMATKYAEATLAVHFRTRENGEYVGGPMYIIRRGLGSRWAWLGTVYSFFGVFASFGVGNAAQINAVITGVNQVFDRFGMQSGGKWDLVIGILLALLVGTMLLGGAKRIGKTAELLVPFLSVTYILLCLGALIARVQLIPGAFASIIHGAFSPRAVTGGLVGSLFQTLRIGVSRGVFTNEAGMGTASIAHASAQVSHPVQQGMMGIMEVFLDTIVICTMTALVILCSGVPIPYGEDVGGTLTTASFCAVYGNWVSAFLALALCCFAIATVLGWGLYGLRCAQYLFGPGARKIYALAQTIVVILACVLKTDTIWSLSETFNGLMAIPNLIALVLLGDVLRKDTIHYKKCGQSAAGGTHENLD